MKYKVIENQNDLDCLVKDLIDSDCREIAVDLEGESNLHRYGFHLCLIQIKTCSQCFLIDPIKIKDISGLKTIFEDENFTKVMYAAEFDIKLLKIAKGIVLKGLFDLQPAASMLGLEKLSLKSALEEFLNISVVKSKKNQQANWNIRPIKDKLLDYAASDVEHLLELKKVMLPKLEELKLLSNIESSNRAIEKSELSATKNPHLSIKRSHKLNRKSAIYLKHFYELREHIAKENDVPVFKVMRNADLATLAKQPPTTESKWLNYNKLSSFVKLRIKDFILYKEAADREIDML